MLKNLIEEISPKLKQLESHKLYQKIDSIETLRYFMQCHAFAVFDFMSLTKSIQSHFAPVEKIWLPPKDRQLSRFVNEIILAEESDITPDGNYMSHFEMYCVAMKEIGANTSVVDGLIRDVSTKGLDYAFNNESIPASSKLFMRDTFSLIDEGQIHKIAASFCFGREKAIPLMFQSLLDKMKMREGDAPLFHYYLKRHIEIDSDSHGPLALKMLSILCGDDKTKWEDAKTATLAAIDSRILFWDQITKEMSSF